MTKRLVHCFGPEVRARVENADRSGVVRCPRAAPSHAISASATVRETQTTASAIASMRVIPRAPTGRPAGAGNRSWTTRTIRIAVQPQPPQLGEFRLRQPGVHIGAEQHIAGAGIHRDLRQLQRSMAQQAERHRVGFPQPPLMHAGPPRPGTHAASASSARRAISRTSRRKPGP